MAATFQTQTPTNNNNNNNNNNKNPQLKRIVYSKYRELLGSYNDKANSIIETLPAYMVKEDRGFHFDPNIIGNVDKVMYGVPPAPTSNGNIPSQRLPTQTLAYEAPACVQNAMMTKDKKPFTYTPGGIDLSQIKSQRMAKRLARNAQIEGATGAPQQNKSMQQMQAQNNGSPQPHSPSMGPAAMGMPFQVFPTGTPPPVQAVKKTSQANGNGPPPPPPPISTLTLAPTGVNGNEAVSNFRKSPTPQNFEPPPMGLRPEIKIPSNPMANLRKVPPPQEKNNFWVEEYRRKSSKSPMVGDDENDYTDSVPSTATLQPETNNDSPSDQQHQYQNSPQASTAPRPEYRRVAAPQSPAVSVYTAQSTPTTTPQRAASPFKFSQEQQQQQQQSNSASLQQQSPQTPQAVPWRTQNSYSPNPNVSKSSRAQEISPQATPNISHSSYNSPQQTQSPIEQEQQSQRPLFLYNNVSNISPALAQQQQTQLQMNSNVGSLYIPPIESQNRSQQPQNHQSSGTTISQNAQQQQLPRQISTNRWMTTQPPVKEPADWVRSEESSNVVPSSINRMKSSANHSNGHQANISGGTPSGLRLHITTNNSSNIKERIIPIELERSPVSALVAQPSFGPQPFYNTIQQQHFSSVPSPQSASICGSNNTALPSYVVRSPNQFVDQGYNNFAQNQQSPQNTKQQTSTPSGTRTHIIPIAIEGRPESANNICGPTSQTPLVIKNDPRTLQHQNSWGGNNSSTPTQSKSFRILQKITDTADGKLSDRPKPSTDESEPQLQRPQYSRQMGSSTQQMNSPNIEQMKRMQISQDQMARNQGASPIMRTPQPNRSVDQHSIYSKEEAPQSYIHPSEQQVPEPKKYTGSSIPSRSFKILQAMTTPENAAEAEGSDVVVKLKESNASQNLQSNNFEHSYPIAPHYYYPYPYNFPYSWYYPTGPPLPPLSSPHSSTIKNEENNNPNWHFPSHIYTNSQSPFNETNPPPPYTPLYFYYPIPHEQPHEHDNYLKRNVYWHPHSCPNAMCSNSIRPYPRRYLPDIIITPSSGETSQHNNFSSGEIRRAGRSYREDSSIDEFSENLNELSKPVESNPNISQNDDKCYVGDNSKEFDKYSNANFSPNRQIRLQSSSDEELSTETETEEEVRHEKKYESLKAIKSVTNIQVYNHFSNENEEEQTMSITEGSDVFDEEIDGEEDEEEELIEEYEEEIEEIEDEDLSVIYEESEGDNQTSITCSDSNTIANEETTENDHQIESDHNECDDENSTSVTVRLPLRFSFSRSSNDENIATIEVGNSEIEERKFSASHFKSYEDVRNTSMVEPNHSSVLTSDDECDVSVTISLPRKSTSFLRNPKLLEDRKTKEEDEIETFSFSMTKCSFVETVPTEDNSNSNFQIMQGPKETTKEKTTKQSLDIEDASFVQEHNRPPFINLKSMEALNFQDKSITCKQFMRESPKENQMWSTVLKPKIENLPKPQVAEIWINPEPDKNIGGIAISDEVYNRNKSEEIEIDEEEIDFWALINRAKENDQIPLTESEDCQQLEEEKDFWAQIAPIDDDPIPYRRNGNFWANPILENVGPVCDVAEISNDKEDEESSESKKTETFCTERKIEIKNNSNPNEECEARRNNYRKAMAFFKTSIDDRREETNISITTFQRDTKSMEQFSAQKSRTCDEAKIDMSHACSHFKRETKSLNRFSQTDETDSYKPWNWKMREGAQNNSCPTESSQVIILASSSPSGSEEDATDKRTVIKGDTCSRQFLNIQMEEFQSNGFREIVEKKNAEDHRPPPHNKKLSCHGTENSFSRNNSSQRSESEIEEDDSGVTDMNKQLSETDTESENFPELRKMTRYQRASTHSRLFKLLQSESEDVEENIKIESLKTNSSSIEKSVDGLNIRSPTRRKIVHNVSITRKQNPKALLEAETMSQRRERLSLPLCKTSIDADNPSTPNSPSSPVSGNTISSKIISDKLVNELVGSLLLKSSSSHLRSLPMEKLQAAAKRVLEEEFNSLQSADNQDDICPTQNTDFEIMPSKTFKALQQGGGMGRNCFARCPRVLSSKTVNRDLTRVTESPEVMTRSSMSPENFTERAKSVGRWRKV